MWGEQLLPFQSPLWCTLPLNVKQNKPICHHLDFIRVLFILETWKVTKNDTRSGVRTKVHECPNWNLLEGSLTEIMNWKPKLKWCPGYLIRQNYDWPTLESYLNGIEPVQEKGKGGRMGLLTPFGNQMIVL